MTIIIHIINGKYAHIKILHNYCFQLHSCRHYIIDILVTLLTKPTNYKKTIELKKNLFLVNI